MTKSKMNLILTVALHPPQK